MKKNILSLALILAAAFHSTAQNVTIPDANFKAYLVANAAINTNADAEIQVSEASTFTGSIICDYININDLTGIEAFTQLTSLEVPNNYLTQIDLSANTQLTSFRCQGNLLTSLDVSANTNLLMLHCYVNQLTSLTLNAGLGWLDCGTNQLTSLDLSNNTDLYSVNCSYNQITGLDVSTNPNLYELYCRDNQLTTLNAANGNNTNFQVFTAINNPSLTCIEVDDAAYSTANWTNINGAASFSEDCGLGMNEEGQIIVNIYPNPVNAILNIESKTAAQVQLVNILGNVIETYTVQQGINPLNIGDLTAGIYFIRTGNGVDLKFVKQ